MSEVVKKMSSASGLDGKRIKDELGREIVLRKPDIMDRFHLMKALGADSSNQAIVGMMIPTIYVAAIDSVPFPTAHTYIEAQGNLKRLGDEGSLVVSEEINKYFESREEESKNTIKK